MATGFCPVSIFALSLLSSFCISINCFSASCYLTVLLACREAMRSSLGRPSAHLLTQFVWHYCPSLDAMGLWQTRVYDVQTCTLKQSNGSAFIGIKFLTALFFSQRENYKSHLVVGEKVVEGARESKVDELVSQWRLGVRKQADIELVTAWMLDWAGITMRFCGLRPLSTRKLSLRHVRLLLTFLRWKVGSQSTDTLPIVQRYGFGMMSRCGQGYLLHKMSQILIWLNHRWTFPNAQRSHATEKGYNEADWAWVTIGRSMKDMDLDRCGLLRQNKTMGQLEN